MLTNLRSVHPTGSKVVTLTKMSPAFSQALGANFQEPSTPDQTSTPPEQPSQSQVSPLLAAIQKSKRKQQGRKPASLDAAISRSKSAKQGAHKWG